MVTDEANDAATAERAAEQHGDDLHRLHWGLERAREQYLDMYRLAPIAYLTLDRAGVILDANLASGLLFAATHAQLTGCRLRNLAERSSIGPLERHLARVFEHGTRQTVEVDLHSFLGKAITVRLHSELETGAVSASARCRTAALDITEDRRRDAVEQRMQVQLHDREARLAAVMRTMKDAVMILDEHQIVEDFCPASERMFGISAAAIEGQPFASLFDGDCGVRGDGTRFPAEIVINPMDLPGPVRKVAFVRDLTEQRRWTEALLKSQKLEALGRLATGIAHDYANVFMGLAGCLELARRHLEPGSPALTYLERGVATVRRGSGLCKQLKSFGRPQPGETCRLDVDALVGETVELLRPVLGETYEVRWSTGAVGAVVIADAGRFEQVVLNLALNARDAMPTGGVVELSSANVTLGGPTGTTYYELGVRDTGVGIPPEQVPRIFEPFFTTKALGTGLGLVMVKQTVEEMCGQIDLCSTPGVGTRVRIRVPLAPPITEAVPPAAVVHPGGAIGGRALVVDDDLHVLAAMERHLEHLGWQVEAVNDPGVALHLCRDSGDRFDLVVTDVMMPALGGGELARALEERGAETPVVFVSGISSAEHIAAGRLPEGTRVLQKPVAMAVLAAELERVLS